MKRMLMALAVSAGLAAAGGTARADWNGFTPPPAPPAAGVVPAGGSGGSSHTLVGAMAAASEAPPEKYGLLPALRKVFHKKKSDCGDCGKIGGKAGGHLGKGGFGHGGGGYGGYGMGADPVMQGTLAFPHHPFVRSPRDFFMWGTP